MTQLKQLQQLAHVGTTATSFDRKYYDLKQGSFSWWNKDLEAREADEEPIVGVIIGTAMKAECFSATDDAFHRTNYYLDNKRVVLYSPEGKLETEGTMEEVAGYCSAKLGGVLKKKKVIWVMTKHGVIELKTNLSLAIDQLRSFTRDDLMDYIFRFTPSVYSKQDPDISRRTKDIMGRIGEQNPPTFVKIERHEKLTDEKVKQLNLIETFQKFNEWRQSHKLRSEIEQDASRSEDLLSSVTDELPFP